MKPFGHLKLTRVGWVVGSAGASGLIVLTGKIKVRLMVVSFFDGKLTWHLSLQPLLILWYVPSSNKYSLMTT